MQVVCSNCQLSFQAPDGATGLVCPICRSPLRAPEGSGEINAAPAKQVIDWAGGSLDDLVALLSAPSWSARIEVLPATGADPVGEVQVIAGGVSDAIFEGKSTHESLDKLRAVSSARFRIEPRLPNPANGDLAAPGPDQGKLEERPLATLMRYCEEFVLTAGIEVWRASENAKVEYKRGEIVGVTVGGIDAPERLAEVMKWSSGSYRLVVPKLTIPETAPKAAAPAAVTPRSMGAASKTIFGMPALDPAAIAAAADKARLAKGTPTTATAAVPPPAAPGMAAAPAPPQAKAASGRATTVGPAVAPAITPAAAAPPPAAAPPAAAAPQAQPAVRVSTNRTIFGVAAPQQPTPTPASAMAPPASPAAATAPPPAARPSSPGVSSPPPPAAPSGSGSAARPTTAVSIPAVTTPAATAPRPAVTAEKAPERAPASAKKRPPATPVAGTDDTTLPTKAAKPKSNGTPVWTYVGVGFVFGLALLGVYRLVMVLAH
jgi:hypothetical protein